MQANVISFAVIVAEGSCYGTSHATSQSEPRARDFVPPGGRLSGCQDRLGSVDPLWAGLFYSPHTVRVATRSGIESTAAGEDMAYRTNRPLYLMLLTLCQAGHSGYDNEPRVSVGDTIDPRSARKRDRRLRYEPSCSFPVPQAGGREISHALGLTTRAYRQGSGSRRDRGEPNEARGCGVQRDGTGTDKPRVSVRAEF